MIKQKLSLFARVCVAVVGLSPLGVQGQTLVIKTKSGTESIKPLESLKSIGFDNDLFSVYLSSNNATEVFSMSDLIAVYFLRWPLSSEKLAEPFTNKDMIVYPNPVMDNLHFKNIPESNFSVRIFKLDGVLVLDCKVETGNPSLDVSTLKPGLYLLKANNQTMKFSKK